MLLVVYQRVRISPPYVAVYQRVTALFGVSYLRSMDFCSLSAAGNFKGTPSGSTVQTSEK